MKRLASLLLILLLLAAAADAAPVVFLVRPAEKTTGGNDPDLSSAGHERADALARILKDSQITAIFVTEFKRTQETAAPTAKETHITPTIVPLARDVAGLAAKLRAVNGNALVVGHSNTIPDLIKALGIAIPINIPDADYTEIFVVPLSDPPQLVRLHYPF